MTAPGVQTALRLAREHFPSAAHVLEVDDGTAPFARELAAAGFRLTSTRPGSAIAPPETVDALVALFPTRHGALMPFLDQVHAALVPEGVAIIADLAWQTAPTPALIQALVPQPGRERVRPIEGYEMQLEHAGFDIIERADIPRAEILEALAKGDARWGAPDVLRAAIEADDRGAARFVAWLVKKT